MNSVTFGLPTSDSTVFLSQATLHLPNNTTQANPPRLPSTNQRIDPHSSKRAQKLEPQLKPTHLAYCPQSPPNTKNWKGKNCIELPTFLFFILSLMFSFVIVRIITKTY
jgi:hypothetical protein